MMSTNIKLLLTILFIIPTLVRAQDDVLPRHEVSFDLGWGSFNRGEILLGCGDDDEKIPISPLEHYRSLRYEEKDKLFSPSFNVQYHYNFRLGNLPVAFGATMAFEQERQKRIDKDYNNAEESRSTTYANMMLSARIYPLYRERVKIYGEAYVGHGHYWNYDFDDVIKSSSRTVYHFTLFGISFGKKMFGYGEFGIGYLGVFRGGIGYRF